MIVDCNCLRATTEFDSWWLIRSRFAVKGCRLLPKVKGGSLRPMSTSATANRCGVFAVDEGSISGGGSEPSMSDSSAPLSLALPSETTRPICKMSGS